MNVRGRAVFVDSTGSGKRLEALRFNHELDEAWLQKTRVFAASLGWTVDQAADLRRELLVAARDNDATPAKEDQYGIRYVVDFVANGPAVRATVRSSWIIRCGEDFPRLTSCFAL